MIKNINLKQEQPVSFQKKYSLQAQHNLGSTIKEKPDSFEPQQVSFNGFFSKEKNIPIPEKLMNNYIKQPTIPNLKALINNDTVKYIVTNYLLAKTINQQSDPITKILKQKQFKKLEKVLNALIEASTNNQLSLNKNEQEIIKNSIKEAATEAFENNPFKFENGKKQAAYLFETRKIYDVFTETSFDTLNKVISTTRNHLNTQDEVEGLKEIVPTFEAFLKDLTPDITDKKEIINNFLKTMIKITQLCNNDYDAEIAKEAKNTRKSFKNLLKNNPNMPKEIRTELLEIVTDAKKEYNKKDLWCQSLYGKNVEGYCNQATSDYNSDSWMTKNWLKNQRIAIASFDKNPNIREADDNPPREPGFNDKDYAGYVLQTDIGKELQKFGVNKEKLTEYFRQYPNPNFYDHDHLTYDGICHPRDLEVAGLSLKLLENLSKTSSDTTLEKYAKEVSRVRCPGGYENDPDNFLIKNWDKIPPAKIAKESKLTTRDEFWLRNLPPSYRDQLKNTPANAITNIREWEEKHKCESYFRKNNATQERIRQWGKMD